MSAMNNLEPLSVLSVVHSTRAGPMPQPITLAGNTCVASWPPQRALSTSLISEKSMPRQSPRRRFPGKARLIVGSPCVAVSSSTPRDLDQMVERKRTGTQASSALQSVRIITGSVMFLRLPCEAFRVSHLYLQLH